jgi:ribosomal-protein-serine acetyltransferase
MSLFEISDQLKLRQIQATDALELFEVIDRNRAHLRQWLGWVDKNQKVSDVSAFIEFCTSMQQKGSLTLGIFFEGRLAGLVSHHAIDTDKQCVALGYWIDKQHEGLGIVRQSVRVLSDYSFRELKLKEVQIKCAVGNERSQSIPKALGFSFQVTIPKGEIINGSEYDLQVFVQKSSSWPGLPS